jgi:hypothetical protein
MEIGVLLWILNNRIMKAKIISTFILFFSILNIHAQNNLIYKGKASGELPAVDGDISYGYYEKDYQKIKNGPFSFSFNSNGVSGKINGTYKDGFRNGAWSKKLTGYGSEDNLTGNFKNGYPDGKFIFSKKKNNQQYFYFEITFREGLAVGNVFCEATYGSDIIKYSGKLTEAGYMDGEWKCEELGQEIIQKFENNAWVLQVERNSSSGEVTKNSDYRAPLAGLSKEDIYSKPRGFLEDDSNRYVLSIRKCLLEYWEENSFGGIQKNPIKGFYWDYIDAKKTLKKIGCKDKEYFSSINFTKKDSLNNTYWYLVNFQKEIETDKNCLEKNKSEILSSELKYRDSIVSILDENVDYVKKYWKLYSDTKELTPFTYTIPKNITSLLSNFDKLRDISFLGYTFSDLKYPSENKFLLADWEKLKISNKKFVESISYVSPSDLKNDYDTKISEYKGIQDEFSRIEKATSEDQKKYYDYYDDQFVKHPMLLSVDLLTQIGEYETFVSKSTEIKNADKLNEKTSIVCNNYISILKTNNDIKELKLFTEKLKKLNSAIKVLISDEDKLKTVLKLIKKEENPASIENIILTN